MSVTIIEELSRIFISHADKVAVRQADSNKTYSQLKQASDSVATYLLQAGLGKGERVALLIENSFEYIASYYGVLCAGGVVVALNTEAKANDLSNWIKHSGSTWLIASAKVSELKNVIDKCSSDINYMITGDHKQSDIADEAISRVSFDQVLNANKITQFPLLSGDDVATIIYTSGTTGKPKGVTLTHTNLLSNMQSILEYMPMSENDSCLNVLPFYYSYGNSVLHTHMMKGATLILQNSFMFPHVVLKKMQNEKVTSFYGVPSTYALLLNRTKLSEFNLSSLRYMTQAGGAMLPAHIERLREQLPDTEFIVMYGQTEATARITYLPCEYLDQKVSSAGKPVSGVELEIRDSQNKKLPYDQQGEIYVSGENIMKGYWNAPDLTATVLKDGWLKTGDLARQDKDGYIYIVGRKTEMIKSGAHRISPLDIEEVLLRCAGVAEVAVIGQSDEVLGQVVKAFIVPLDKENIKKRDIQLYCKNNLAVYKIPKIIEFIDELPKTASGKLKRFALQNIH
ncbi:Long-chain-fatty-acid--CoA ligase [hydrothermal vent metagenome]|uniref:Long-chain-fatty-acid--CoA ligase n=1 Tax=hydrothermal vent metagenome TaxID=652676 RepID=A0A3B0XQ10_9ZZZZ